MVDRRREQSPAQSVVETARADTCLLICVIFDHTVGQLYISGNATSRQCLRIGKRFGYAQVSTRTTSHHDPASSNVQDLIASA